ncbi:MAG: hypothetical protein A2268_16245 [Candidatus Raymondbacteria bacterium RifOxyA12_full_50_37]|uniref:Uncharacterized protein n=1 Tax=Candidatus Raymondbacteria bacterium RIFOXYD12_FULL_49_13 TaxID=1817890 RepID=A0A1F7F7X4_UNCRA|nr:MAG: hypothetical protein A2268_16245 [Candidatus Raymondbacteria bacterium RifOxyA12_full_50_37]OGJ94348.1 MAG: hypothetical protein A2248_14440 [Candidatus Raymondbacteria bacterium RIFOXYA2_FULL_49_16]OGJ95290.1 MAG: hypothetical protein A2453_05865 [Candidatus Raymondbacteria bacterium RIFOXYC2_FULL_50_21]OGJ99822.1 MAG: hypothetical protein A2487_10830 [Candidatus Raymondbacteria bacterium RifOxyC12_full_50_8]OGK02765.1 MAG: hypothetical protein A2519_07435 [Candidatus Raymondbacteria b
MQTNDTYIRRIETAVAKDPRYKMQAYLFILGGLEYTLKKLSKKGRKADPKKQVTGQELSHGIKEYALAQFGPTAKMVFDHWGIRGSGDFGNIVYNLIDTGLMGKSETDRIEDFNNVFSFEDEFVNNYRFKVDPRRL